MTQPTIVAIASPTVPARRGIVRLSGDDLMAVLRRMGIDSHNQMARPHRFTCDLKLSPPLGQVPAEVLLWPTNRSYTGMPSAEIHLIGCTPLLATAVDAAIAAGARAARPGEFTMRAFMAGRLDLTQAEAVLGVIEAEQPAALQSALEQLAGNLSAPLMQVRDDLMDLIADVEAGLDFVDEDIEFISDEQIRPRLEQSLASVRATQNQLRGRGPVRTTTRVVLRGLPNAGKSRLLNAMLERDAAIVSEVSGTTRDTVEAEVTIANRSFRFFDTAGVESTDPNAGGQDVMNIAQTLGRQAELEADIRLWCVDSSSPDPANVLANLRSSTDATSHTRASHPSNSSPSTKRASADLSVATKVDLAPAVVSLDQSWVRVSSVSGEGLDLLRQRLIQLADEHDASEVGGVMGTAARCHESLMEAERSLRAAEDILTGSLGYELLAGELRLAVEAMGQVTGAIVTDDILDRIFSRFCIGK